jgi:stage III sporulation protein AF
MAWLNEWVKELILIILVAAFTDLLLPSHALQRYVRTVIGLFLLLVLLSPLYELFHYRWNSNTWMQAALGEPTATQTGMQPLTTILQQSSELKASNEKQAKQLLERQLEVSMKAGIESSNGMLVKVDKLQVNTKLDGNGKPAIDQVYIVLVQETKQLEPNTEATPKDEPFIKAMKPVEPVIIKKDIYEKKQASAEANPQVTPEPASPQTAFVKQYISREWQIQTDRIHVELNKAE